MFSYDDLNIHRLMVGDEPRTRSFERSIRSTVRKGDVVLDVGAGSGILSLFAAQAGAARVYAVERAPVAAALARRLIAENGFADVIQVLPMDMDNLWIPEQVDVLVSEWLGVYGVDENMLAPVLQARDRCLKPGGAMIPSVVTAFLAPVKHPAAEQALQLRGRVYGLDLSALAPFSPHEVVWLKDPVSAEALRAEAMPLWVSDCATMPAAEARSPYAAELSFPLTGTGVNGFAAWFEAQMPGTEPLSNAPGQPAMHWGQFLFPVSNAADFVAGERLEVGFHNVPASLLGSHHIWASRGKDGAMEVHDTRKHPDAGSRVPWRAYAE